MDQFEDQNLFPENYEEAAQPPVSEEPPAQPETPAARAEAPAAQPESYAYRGSGAGRRESPYADSPYVMHNQSQYGSYHTSQQPQYAPPRKPKAKKAKGFWKKALAVAAALALVAGSCGITAALVNSYWEGRTESMESRFQSQIQDLQQQIDAQSPASTGNSVSGTVSSLNMYSAGQVYAQNVHSVVLIECTITSNIYGQTATGMSAGSGFILTEDGYMVTNYHVVQGATAVNVVLHDGTKYAATVVGYDSTNDVAVLKVEATGLDPVVIGSSDDLIVGDQVVAIGNPLGELTSTLTVGYVSAKERDVTTDGTVINMLQTDCAINSGNSGGPLFNMKGEVVGITTAKYSGSSSSGASIEGIGFAIPIDDVLDGIGQLMEFGYIKSAYLGVMVQSMDSSVAELYGLPLGVQVVSVEEGFCAQRAGIQPKDIILAVGQERIESLADLTKALRGYEPGDEAQITLYRSGREMQLTVVLDERPADLDNQTQTPEAEQMPEGDYKEWFKFFAPFFGD